MRRYGKLISPLSLRKKLTLDKNSKNTAEKTKKDIINILNGKDKRKIFIIGPCSVHDVSETLEYAKKLSILSQKVKDKILIIMRTYFEKPRTGIDWEGLIDDPDMNGSNYIGRGLALSRKLLLKTNNLGLPCATEFLDFLNYLFIEDLISFCSIGARTSESQPHREMVSGLNIPSGFKNSINGNINNAINSIKVAGHPQHYVGINYSGQISKVITSGNKNCVLILRGSSSAPNYEQKFVKHALKELKHNGLPARLIIDCSHGNSGKSSRKQIFVFKEVVNQMKRNQKIVGLMIESYLKEGNQNIPKNLKSLKKGVSVTDECISWKDTEELILNAYNIL